MQDNHIELATELRRALPDAFIQAEFDAVIAAFNRRIEELEKENKRLIATFGRPAPEDYDD